MTDDRKSILACLFGFIVSALFQLSYPQLLNIDQGGNFLAANSAYTTNGLQNEPRGSDIN